MRLFTSAAALAVLFSLLSPATASTDPFSTDFDPVEAGYYFPLDEDAVQSQIKRGYAEYNNGARNQTTLRPLKRARTPNKKRDIAEVLVPAASQDLFWAEDPTLVHGGTVAYVKVEKHISARSDNKGIVDLDLIEDLLETQGGVLCQSNPDQIGLIFRTKDGFTKAADAWKYVNEGKENHFILMVSPPACDFIDKREPFKVTKMEVDKKSGMIILDAHVIGWGDAMPQYEMQMKQTAPMKIAPFDEEKEGANRHTFKEGYCDVAYTLTYPIAQVSKPAADLIAAMVGCARVDIPSWEVDMTKLSTETSFGVSKGPVSVQLGGDVSGKLFFDLYLRGIGYEVDAARFRVRPLGLALDGDLNFAATQSIFPGFSHTFATAVPLGGIFIPGFLAIGPFLGLELSLNALQVMATASLSIGARWKIPDEAYVEFEYNPETEKFEDKSNLEPLKEHLKNFDLGQIKAGVQVSTGISAVPRASVEVKLKLFESPLAIGFKGAFYFVPAAFSVDLSMQRSFTCSACGMFDTCISGSSSISQNWGLALGTFVGSEAHVIDALTNPDVSTPVSIGLKFPALYEPIVIWQGVKGWFDENSACPGKALMELQALEEMGLIEYDEETQQVSIVAPAEWDPE